MSIVAEAALSAFFDLLFDKLSSTDLLKIFRQENVDADLKKWTMKLRKIDAVLADAEEKQMTDKFVKSWLAELQDLAYDADDILDEFAIEALRRELNAEEPSTSTVIQFFNDCVGSDRDFVKQMRSKIEGIDRRLQVIVEEKKDLELRENTGGRTKTTILRPPTTSLAESHTYGRDKDKKEIVKLLLESSDAQLPVIPIVGMGGLGKTTLAQLVYKDDEVSRHFKEKAWVCVSEDFDNLRLTKEILHSFTFESWDKHSTLNTLQVKLGEKLSRKKFLLILDDVWNKDYELWTQLRKPLESGAPGSKIVVTTRDFGVTSTMGTTPPYTLEELSHDACLRVFTHHALDATDFSKYPELKEFGQKIVNKCKGVPLAAKVLGGLLRTTRNRKEWEHVLNSKILDIPEEKGKIFSVLKLSYNYLPSPLKRCFAYFSLFPKDYEFGEEDVVLLWMAEGLVQETKGKKPMEDLAGDYFRELLNRSFIQKSSRNESLFVMHDLMHDLAVWEAGDLCCGLEDQSEISTKVRHLSYIEHSNDCIQKFGEDVHLRTFLSLPLYNEYGLTNFDVKLLPQLRCLRVLSLSGNDIFELPSSIGDLKHLRYLNLSYTKITILPESTSSLYNLQTLILKGCYLLTKLPEKIENLVNLRHLHITNSNSLTKFQEKIENLVNLRHLYITDSNSSREMPGEIAKLKSLQKLCFEGMCEWQDWISCGVGCEEFPCLRELSISNCPKLKGKLPHLPSLEKLFIDECNQLVVSIPSLPMLQELLIKGCKDVVDGFVKAEKLIILDCEVTSLSLLALEIIIQSCPSLVNIKLKSTLRKLTIEFCAALESVESLIDEGGASSTSFLSMNVENFSCIGNNNASFLEHLEISECPSLKCISTIVDQAAMLKRLDIRECPNLTSLSSGDTLPTTLEHLSIYGCENLRCLPRGLHELCHLKEIYINSCNSLISLGDLLPTNLISLEIFRCEKLEALPNNMHNLNFLQYLSIRYCPGIVSFPEEGFPTNLRDLKFSGVNLCKQVFEFGLHRLTLLTSLEIADGTMDLFPEEEDGKTMLMLPTSLTTLTLFNSPNLLFLSWKFFQNLSALEELHLICCDELAALSEKCFPLSLQRLKILGCPVLKQNCEKDKGIMWPKIANIPSVIIDEVEQQK